MTRSLFLGFLVLCAAQGAGAVEIFKWNRVPLPIQLGVGHERIIFVDRNVSVGVPRSLTDRLRIQSVAGAVYLLPNEQVPPTRLQLRDDESGEIILLDIATVDSPKPLEPAKIVTVDPATESSSNSASTKHDGAPQSPPGKTPAPVALTRYAAQMMYAPLRTVEPLPGVRQVPVRVSGQLSTLAPTLDVDAVATGAWSLGKWTVTAIRLSNRRPDSLNLDPRHLQGDLYSAAFQHRYLGPRGSADDTTTVYVITVDKSLDLALIPAPVAAGEADRDE